MIARHTRRLTLIAAIAATSLIAVTVPASAAPTSPPRPVTSGDLAHARAQAAALNAQLNALDARAETASEAYDQAEEQLGAVVNQMVVVSQRINDERNAVSAAQMLNGDRASQLYMAGGPLGLYASVLDGSNSLSDVLDQIQAVQSIMDATQSSVVVGQQRLVNDRADETALAALTSKQTQLTAAVNAQATAVQSAISQRQAALASANATITELAAQIQQQQIAAAEAAARAQFATLKLVGTPPPDNPWAVAAIQAAGSRLGDPYVWGATGPAEFDCSGLTQWSYAQAGLALPRTARDQWDAGRPVALADLRPGDLLFYATDINDPATIHHVVMYVGGGMIIEAPHTGAYVQEVPVYLDGFIGARRPGPGAPVTTVTASPTG